MPSAGQISFVFDQTRMRWMTSLTSGRFQPPLSLTEGNTVDFVFRLSNNGTLFTPPLTPVWIFGIKDANTPSGDFLIQVNSATVASGVYTFVVELASAELQTWLATATSQSYAAIQITDSANDIATAPLLCQIAPNQNDTGTTPTSANGTLSVAAGKTVTFPLSLTFPAAAGTNGYHLALLNSTTGTTEWVVDATGTTIATDPIWTAAGQLVYGTGTGTAAALAAGATTSILVGGGAGAPVWTVATGTGAPVRENAPTLIAPTLGAATATSLNAATGTLTIGVQTLNLAAGAGPSATGGSINLSGGGGDTAYGGSINLSGSSEDFANGGSLNLSGGEGSSSAGGSINLSGGTGYGGGSINMSGGASPFGAVGGSINTSDGGGSIDTTAGGSITTGVGSLTGPSASGTIALINAAQTFTGTQTITGTTQNSLLVSATSTTDASASTNCVAVFQQGTGTTQVPAFTNVAINLRATASNAYVDAFIGSSAAGRINITGNGSSTTLNVANSNSPNGNGGSGVVLTGGGNITNNGANIMTPEAIAPALNAAGTCSATITTTGFALNGVNALSLANGTNGQIKIISCTAVTAAGTATLTPTTSAADYSTIAFTAAGQTATLQFFTTGGWYILSVRGAVPA